MAGSIFSLTKKDFFLFLRHFLPVGRPSLAALLKAGTEARPTGFTRGLEILRSRRALIPIRNQKVAQAFQPVPAQAKACGYKNNPLIATRYQNYSQGN